MERVAQMQNHRIALIAAIGERTRALGKNNALLFTIEEDLKRFRTITRGHPVIMGRKTWESLPDRVRPLPGRANFVVTRNGSYDAPGATVCTSLQEAIELAKNTEGSDEVFVIGGGELYAEALPAADILYLTLVDDDTEGDVHFPPYPEFTKVREDVAHDSGGYRYRYLTLTR
jgi:dihydrofolate reductase